MFLPYLLGREDRSIHYSRCMKLISIELILDNMQYINEKLTMGEDAGIMIPVIMDAEYIVVMEDAFYYHYRFVDASMAHKYNTLMFEKVELLYKTLEKTIQKKVLEEKQKASYLENLKKEYVYLLFFVLKNELRGPKETCIKRIQEMIGKANKEKDLERIKVEVNSKANKLLYYILKHPNKMSILFGRAAIGLFDKMQ